MNYYHTIISLGAGLLVISFVFEISAFFWIATVILFASAVSSRFARMIAVVWLSITAFVGNILSQVALAFIFFLILTPVALVRRAVSVPSLFVFKKQGDTQYVARHHRYESRDLEQVW